MKNKSFNISKLLWISFVFLVFIFVIVSHLLTESSKAREKAFRAEATKIVEASKKAVDKMNESTLAFSEQNSSCRYNQLFCFTVDDLIKMNLYDGDANQYLGKIEVNAVDPYNIRYNLFFKKNNEFKIIRGIHKDYIDKGVMSIEPWKEEYSICSCVEN